VATITAVPEGAERAGRSPERRRKVRVSRCSTRVMGYGVRPWASVVGPMAPGRGYVYGPGVVAPVVLREGFTGPALVSVRPCSPGTLPLLHRQPTGKAPLTRPPPPPGHRSPRHQAGSPACRPERGEGSLRLHSAPPGSPLPVGERQGEGPLSPLHLGRGSGWGLPGEPTRGALNRRVPPGPATPSQRGEGPAGSPLRDGSCPKGVRAGAA
jgi:hypothetical protein